MQKFELSRFSLYFLKNKYIKYYVQKSVSIEQLSMNSLN